MGIKQNFMAKSIVNELKGGNTDLYNFFSLKKTFFEHEESMEGYISQAITTITTC